MRKLLLRYFNTPSGVFICIKVAGLPFSGGEFCSIYAGRTNRNARVYKALLIWVYDFHHTRA